MIGLVLALSTGGADLEDLARRHALTWTADAATGRHVIRAGSTTLVVAPRLRWALVDNVSVSLAVTAEVVGGRLKLPPELVRVIERSGPVASKKPVPPARVEPPSFRLPACRIAIDAGHGGIHTGGKGRTGLLEKDINLAVALELQAILQSWGATVSMTRSDDVHFAVEVDDDLDHRVRMVNRVRPDLFISVHTNFHPTADPRGFEVWVAEDAPAGRDRDSREFASLLRSGLRGVWDSEDRGTKEKNFRVLRGTTCPAALVELEFVSNPSAERQLASAAVRRRLAESIADAARQWILRRK